MKGKLTYSPLENRLGNNLFMIAATIETAIRHGMEFEFPEWKYIDYFPNLKPFIKTTFDHCKAEYYNEPHFHFSSITLDSNKNYNLHGRFPMNYFQSEKYFDWCRDRVIFYLQIDKSLIGRIMHESNELLMLQPTSIHVRRGDYLTIPHLIPTLPFEYYNKAVEYFGKDEYFLVFSDDTEWCKKHFIGSKFFVVEGQSEIEDFVLMSLCQNNIIANSSFSVWASMYNENECKKIVAPKKDRWFGAKLKHNNLDDLYNDNWILI